MGGVKRTQDDDGWEVATGNELKLSSESITPCPYPHERSRVTSKTRGSNHEVVESLFEQIKVAQKVRLKNTLSLPGNFRNGKRKDIVPKYTILRRDAEVELNDDVDMTSVLKTAEIQLSSIVKIANANDRSQESQNGCRNQTDKVKKRSSTKSMTSTVPCLDKGVQTVSHSEKSVQVNVCVSSKHKQIETSTLFSPKKTSKAPSAPSSPSASPGVRRNVKKQTKMKTTDSVVERQEQIGCPRVASLPSQKKNCSNGEKLKYSLDLQLEKNDKIESVAYTQKPSFLEKKNVSRVIGGTTKQRFDNVGSIFTTLAKIMGLIFLYYIIIVQTY